MFNIFQSLKRFDAYPKTLDDVSVKTYGGGIATITSISVIIILVIIELNSYLTPDVSEELFVDTSRSPKIQINLDIVLPKISCDFLTLDAMDSSGEQHLQVDHNIYKQRLNSKGEPIEEPQREDIMKKSEVNTTESPPKNETKCGSCYGAELDPKQCCNTCNDVKLAYYHRRWAFPDNPVGISQCKDEKYDEKVKLAFEQGCQITGTLIVNRVEGSFHVAPGKSFTMNHMHVHDVMPFSSNNFNTSHIIRHLSFGESIDGNAHNPLKDTQGITEDGATMFQYYIKIVPTVYEKLDGQLINANQFSVTKHQKSVLLSHGDGGMPGVFFQYELSPLMVKYTVKERSIGHFLTNVCAIIGGVYTVAGLLDAFFYHSYRLIQKKIELGKFS